MPISETEFYKSMANLQKSIGDVKTEIVREIGKAALSTQECQSCTDALKEDLEEHKDLHKDELNPTITRISNRTWYIITTIGMSFLGAIAIKLWA